MQRVLDLDLDFFLEGVVHFPPDSERRDPSECPPLPVGEVLSFLRERCRLDRPIPGFVVEHHHELFSLWRAAIEAGQLVPPSRKAATKGS